MNGELGGEYCNALETYLLVAAYNWCVDTGSTPYLAAMVNEHVSLPEYLMKQPQITLNVSPGAAAQLEINDYWVTFKARFNGESFDVAIPRSQVTDLRSAETGEGVSFAPVEYDPATDLSLAAAQSDAPCDRAGTGARLDAPTGPEPDKAPARSAGAAGSAPELAQKAARRGGSEPMSLEEIRRLRESKAKKKSPAKGAPGSGRIKP